jgi:hypothetical protein
MDVISASVGDGGKNLEADVKIVQNLLGRHWMWLVPLTTPAVTGKVDTGTIMCIKQFQTTAAVLLHPDGVVSPHGFTIKQLARPMIPAPVHKIFTSVTFTPLPGGLAQADFDAAAKTLGCDSAAIQAVAQVETKQSPWDSLGRPTILYERAYFSGFTKNAYDVTHPDISSPAGGGYGLFSAQYPKLHRAAVLDETAALKSASWGAFQIMGANFQAAGYTNVADFVTAMMLSESKHLAAFVSFIAANPGMLTALKALNWASFASQYNGPGYADNDYDTKMANAYKALSPPPKPAAPVKK